MEPKLRRFDNLLNYLQIWVPPQKKKKRLKLRAKIVCVFSFFILLFSLITRSSWKFVFCFCTITIITTIISDPLAAASPSTSSSPTPLSPFHHYRHLHYHHYHHHHRQYHYQNNQHRYHHCYLAIVVQDTASLMAQTVKNLPAMRETWVRSLGQEDPLEKGMATLSSILAWEIPWTEEPGGLQSKGSQKSWTQLSDEHLALVFKINRTLGLLLQHFSADISFSRALSTFSLPFFSFGSRSGNWGMRKGWLGLSFFPSQTPAESNSSQALGPEFTGNLTKLSSENGLP